MKLFTVLILCCLALTQAFAIEDKYLALLEQLVNTNSGTKNISGIAAVRTVLKTELEKRGLTVQVLGDERKVLTAKFPGTTPNILLIGHLDTVFSVNDEFQSIRKEGDKIFGPGVIDMKGGLVMMLNLIDQLQEKERKNLRKICKSFLPQL